MNSVEPILQSLLASRRGKAPLPPQPIDPEAAAAQALATLTNPDGDVLPAEAFKLLAARNNALVNASDDEIRTILARQAVLLEAASVRYLTKAAVTGNIDHAAQLMKVSLNAQRALMGVLGAVRQMNEDRHDAEVLDTDPIHA
jgi:hypothetical protein